MERKKGATELSKGHRQQFKILSKQMKVVHGERRGEARHVVVGVCVCVLCELAARAAPKTQTDCGERQKKNEEHKAQHVRLKLIKFAPLSLGVCVSVVCV